MLNGDVSKMRAPIYLVLSFMRNENYHVPNCGILPAR